MRGVDCHSIRLSYSRSLTNAELWSPVRIYFGLKVKVVYEMAKGNYHLSPLTCDGNVPMYALLTYK